MKTNIRKQVFETNSSSTHSLQIGQMSVAKAKELIDNRIKETYASSCNDNNYFNIDDYIDESTNTLYLKGFQTESGHANSNVYYIVTTWMAKLQYLAMFLHNYEFDIEGYDKETYLNTHYPDTTSHIILNTETYKVFEKLIKQYMLTKNYVIDNIVFKISDLYNNSIYIEKVEGEEQLNNIFTYTSERKYITATYFESLFNKVMDENYVITYADEAYNPYYDPKIYII